MSPDSQCLPTTRTSIGSASLVRDTSATEYSASYSAVRMLSDMPPSTETYVRRPSSGLIVPTSYSVNAVGPTIARPGSTLRRGAFRFAAAHSRRTISASAAAISAGSRGSSSLVYAMPRPPPRSISGSSTPCVSRTSDSRPTTRRAATSKPAMSKICEPMCEWMPRSSRLGRASTWRTASAAAPPLSDRPNFWSSCAVAMNSWVCASTPTVTRTSTAWRTPWPAAMAASRAISSYESTTMCPTPSLTACSSSSMDLLLPCSAIRSAGIPPASATASSPGLHTSRFRPSSCSQRTIAFERNALPA